MSAIAVITARGGSKRIPRKNIKKFLGRPIISYSIQAAIASRIFDEVMVSTDDEEIAEIAVSYGASIPFYRSKETSDDYATTVAVLNEVVHEYQERGKRFDWLCCIYPTAPFVNASRLTEGMQKIIEEEADALVPVVRYSHPPQRAYICNSGSYLEYKWPENENKRTQDFEIFYHDAGQFYFYKIQKGYNHKVQSCGKIVPFFLSEKEVQDIDSLEDWNLAELKYQLLNSGRK